MVPHYIFKAFLVGPKKKDEAMFKQAHTKNKNLSKNDLKKGARRRLETTTSKTVLYTVL